MTDLLVIGDIGIDTYYMLDNDDASICHTQKDNNDNLCFDLAEKIPVEEIKQTVGGNAANVALGATKLGLSTVLLSGVGKDDDGKTILHYLESHDIDLEHIDISGKTNQTVALVYKGQRTLLVHHEQREYDFHAPANVRWIYLTSTNVGGNKINGDIIDYIQKNNSKLVFSPGTLQRHAGPSRYRDLLENCDVIIMNKQEAQDYVGSDTDNITGLLEKLTSLGPEIAVITDTVHGSYGKHDDEIFSCDICPANTVDNTGAGDAYSTALTVALAQGKSLSEAMRWGSANAASVVGFVGPQEGLLNETQIHNKLGKCPACKPLK